MEDKNKQDTALNESNAERDQDEGRMNNGTLGGNMEIKDSSSNQDNADNSVKSNDETNTGNAGENSSGGNMGGSGK